MAKAEYYAAETFLKLIKAYVQDPTASEEARLYMIGYWVDEALRGGEPPSVLDWPIPGDAGGYGAFFMKVMSDLTRDST